MDRGHEQVAGSDGFGRDERFVASLLSFLSSCFSKEALLNVHSLPFDTLSYRNPRHALRVLQVRSLSLVPCLLPRSAFPDPLLPCSFHPLSEFLIHAADVEGLCQGIDEELVTSKLSFTLSSLSSPLLDSSLPLTTFSFRRRPPSELGEWVTIPTTYAGGAKGTFIFSSFRLSGLLLRARRVVLFPPPVPSFSSLTSHLSYPLVLLLVRFRGNRHLRPVPRLPSLQRKGRPDVRIVSLPLLSVSPASNLAFLSTSSSEELTARFSCARGRSRSALDIFGGTQVKFDELAQLSGENVKWNQSLGLA